MIRNNQNRIHSIALLHKKLNIDESVSDVDLKRYISELSQLVKDSYNTANKNVNLYITCKVESLSISKALPVGLIVVELVSNSMKHAFDKQSNGIINIEVTKDEKNNRNKLHYVDNGVGFDFNKTDFKGLGVEIMKGLIDQLNATHRNTQKQRF
ncbi:MAG: histidine kinase dimerization/phosphoacceptor domain -containing protein [Spirosomataceae bacterium]